MADAEAEDVFGNGFFAGVLDFDDVSLWAFG